MVPKRPRPLPSGLQELLERYRAIVLEVKVNVAKARWLCAKLRWRAESCSVI